MASCLAAFEPYPAGKAYGSITNPWQPASSDVVYHQQAGVVEPYPTGIWVPESLACDYLPPGVTRVLSVTDRCPYSMRLRREWAVRDFVFVKEIGTGNASTVWYAFCKKTSAPLAIKTYKKRKLSPLNRCQVAREINIHSQLDHPNIIALYAAFEDNDKVYLLQEYAEGGDLFDEMKRTMGRMPENQLVTAVLLPMMSALLAMHSAGFIHRDIKPENTLFASGRVLKLADFGLAVNHVIERPVTRLGTLDYMAPEVLVCPDKHLPTDNKERSDLWYTPAVDAWALGVLAYELAVGRPPFGMSTRDETIRAIRQCPPSFPEFMSPGLVDYISHALVKPADQRSSLADLMQHPWVMEHARRAGMEAQVLAYLRVHQPAERQLLAAAAAVPATAASNAAAAMQQQQQQPLASAAAPAGPVASPQQQQQHMMMQHNPAAATAAVPEPAVPTPGDSSNAVVPNITVTSPVISGSVPAVVSAANSATAAAGGTAAAAAAAAYLAGLAAPDAHMMVLGGDVSVTAAAAAAGMASGGPPRVKKTAKRTGMPRCFSSKNVAGLSSLAAMGSGHPPGVPHGHGHIHWHANGETLALHVPGLLLDMHSGSDSPRSNSPNNNSPTAAVTTVGAAVGLGGMPRAASMMPSLPMQQHKLQQQQQQQQHVQDGYNPLLGGFSGLGNLLPGLAGMQAAAVAASVQQGLLPGSPTRRALAAARVNTGSNGSGGSSKQNSSSKRCTPEPDSDMAATLLALGQNSSSSPCSSAGAAADAFSPHVLQQQQQLMQQYLRQQQQMHLQGSGAAGMHSSAGLAPAAAAAAAYCQVHGSFVSPNASPKPMSRLGAGSSSSTLAAAGGCGSIAAGVSALLGQQQQQQSQHNALCNCALLREPEEEARHLGVARSRQEAECGAGLSSAAASAAGSSSGRSSGTKFSPCSPVLKAALAQQQQQHLFESPLKRVNSQGTLQGSGSSSAAAAAALAPQLSLPANLPPLQQHKLAELQQQHQVSGIMHAADLDRMQHAAAAAARRSSATTPSPTPLGTAAGHGGNSTAAAAAAASPAGLHMQELADVLASPGSVATLLQEHQQQQIQREYAAQQQQQHHYLEQQQAMQQQLMAQQQQQQQQLRNRKLAEMRRPVMRACSAPSLLHPALQQQLQYLQQQQQQQGLSWYDAATGSSPPNTNGMRDSMAAAAAGGDVSGLSAMEQMQIAAQQQQQYLAAAASPFAAIGAALSSMDCSNPGSPSAAAAAAAVAGLARVNSMGQGVEQQQQLSGQYSGVLSGHMTASGVSLPAAAAALYRANSPGLALLQQQQQASAGQLLQAAASWEAAAAALTSSSSAAASMQHNAAAYSAMAAAAAAANVDLGPVSQQQQHCSTGLDAVAAAAAAGGPANGRGGLSRSQSLLSELGPLQPVPESSAATYEQPPTVLVSQPCSTATWQQQQQLQAQQQLQEIAGALLLQQQQQVQAAQQQQQQAMQLQMCGGSGNLANAADVYHLAAMACSQGATALNPAGNTSPLNPRLLMRHAPSRLAQVSSPLTQHTAAAAAAALEEL